jgi:para-aminobenzoate synthetase/4-amino-4-deoxychorismate lyase
MGFARFDDNSPGSERSLVLTGARDVVVARELDDVVAALRDVQGAVAGGLWAAGFVAYEAAPAFDDALSVRRRPIEGPFSGLPLVWFGLYDEATGVEPLAPRADHPAAYAVSTWSASISETQYRSRVGVIRDHVADGDTYQVNFSMRLRAAFSGDPFDLYRDLVLAQRGAYGAYLDVDRFRVLSASPERFFRIVGREICTRPMKGTTARGRWQEEDAAAAQRLRASAKDRAENLMIVDLLRNDLGKIAESGSVRADKLLTLERYETIWQLTSEISAELSPDVDLVSVLQALFPPGSVTGAPKARSMEIIAALEHSARGVYCGTIGFLSPPGSGGPDASFNVAIRTVLIDAEEGVAEYGVGGAVTWDSSPIGEYEEARAKAQLLVQRRPEFDLVETIRWDGQWWWLDHHLDRLGASADYFGFAFDREAIADQCRAAAGSEPQRLRLALTRAGNVAISNEDLGAAKMRTRPGPGLDEVKVVIDEEPISSADVFRYHKTSLRRPYTMRRNRHSEADDVFLVNERGEVTESTICNVAVQKDGVWYTPPIESGCLPGILRRVLIEEGLLEERPLTVEEVASATDVAVINSVRGWRRAVLV